MRIALLSCFPPFRGGISQFNTHLLEELGRDNDVRAFNFKRQYPEILFPGRTQYVEDNGSAVSVESTALLDTADPFSWGKTAKAIRGWNPDLLLVRYWMSWFAPSLGYVTRRMDKHCKVVSILDNVIPHEPHFFDAPLTRYFLRGSDGCVAMCESVAADLLALSPSKPHIILPHPLSDQFGQPLDIQASRRELGLDPDRKTLLFFGLIRDYKGLDILLDAFNLLDDGFQLVIAGEPYGSFEKYAAQIEASPAKEHIHVFPDFISDAEVGKYFSAADLVVLPYRSATQSGVSPVAVNFGIPLVVTPVGGLEEQIGDRGTGLVCPDCSPASVAGQICRYFSDSSLREHCRECIELEKKRLSWKSFCGALLDFAQTL